MNNLPNLLNNFYSVEQVAKIYNLPKMMCLNIV